MSIFDLFRGFFGFPGGRYSGSGRRDPFFDGMTHNDDDEDDDRGEDDCCGAGYSSMQHDPFDDSLRFGFSFGPSGLRIQEPQLFGHVLREMEELFSSVHLWDQQPAFGHTGVPQMEDRPPQGSAEHRGAGAGRGSLRDFMLKHPDGEVTPHTEPPPSHQWKPFFKFDLWGEGPKKEYEDLVQEDRDLDSKVASEGLDKILSPPSTHSQPKIRSFSQTVTIKRIVLPDGTVEERRTVRDTQGNEETTVTRSGGPQNKLEPPSPGKIPPSAGLQDDFFLSKFFGSFRG